jgi:ribonuclease III
MSDILEFQKKLNIEFKDPALLHQAFVHSSYINETGNANLSDNERLEFLGDAILDFVVAEKIYHKFPSYPEGKLTEIRIFLIREETLALIAAELNLGDYLLLGKGEEASGGKNKQSNLANTVEALIGAVYLDQGLEITKTFLNGLLDPYVNQLVSVKSMKNYKGVLQEYAQSLYKKLPLYRLTDITGPDHERVFTVEVVINNEIIGSGTAKSKKAAEMEAAKLACEHLAITAT